jgi:hypothetical protein
MPVNHTVDHGRRAMHATAAGPITMDDIRKHLAGERRDRAMGYCELIEATGATVAFSAGDVRKTVDLLHVLSQEGALGPTAIVVGDDVSYGMVRMLGMLVEGLCEVRPFRGLHEAELWLTATCTETMTRRAGA